MVQYNFKIEDELKERLDKALAESGAENKAEFLEQMVSALAIHKASDVGIDFSRYENVSNQAKNILNDAFKHILTTIDANLSNTKNEAISLDAAKKALADKEEGYATEILKLKADHSNELEALKKETDTQVRNSKEKAEHLSSELQSLTVAKTELDKEFENVSKVADSVQFITEENNKLRKTMSAGEEELKSLTKIVADQKEIIFKNEVESESKDKEIARLEAELAKEKALRSSEVSAIKMALTEEVSSLSTELKTVQSDYDKAVGKLEILQQQEKNKQNEK